MAEDLVVDGAKAAAAFFAVSVAVGSSLVLSVDGLAAGASITEASSPLSSSLAAGGLIARGATRLLPARRPPGLSGRTTY